MITKRGRIVELGRHGEIDVDCGAGDVYVVAGQRNLVPYASRQIGVEVEISAPEEMELRRRMAWTARLPGAGG